MNASSLRLKVYKMAVSTQPNCSNPTVIFTKSNPSYTDFKNNPDLGSGNLADGTYPCVIIEFSDNIKITPDGNGTYCQIATENTQDVCRTQDWNGDGDTTDPGETTTATLIDGSTTTCTNGDDRVAMYLTTASTQTNEVDAFNPPACNTPGCATSGPGINLASALSVSGTAVGQFSVNTDGKVCDGNDGFPGGDCGLAQAINPCACESDLSCNMMVPGFSFSQI
jgi:hypothetical protein